MKHSGQVGFDGADVGIQVGLFSYQCDIEVTQPQATDLHQAIDSFQENDAGEVFVLGIVVGEMRSDVRESRRSQNGVAERVQDHIRVRVSFQAPFVGDDDSTQ